MREEEVPVFRADEDYKGALVQMYQNYLDKSTPYTTYRWIATATVFIAFGLRIVFAQGWYIGTSRADKTHGEQSSKPVNTTEQPN
jgi:hypothetical protein